MHPSKFNDINEIRKSFYRAFDHTRFEDVARKIINGNDDYFMPRYFLGEGVHFQAFKVRHLNQDLVLRISHDELLADRCAEETKTWINSVNKVRNLELALIPPVEIIQINQRIAVVSPYGDLDHSAILDYWLPLSSELTNLEANLEAHSLYIGDNLQVAAWKGIPFIYDLSDLKKIR